MSNRTYRFDHNKKDKKIRGYYSRIRVSIPVTSGILRARSIFWASFPQYIFHTKVVTKLDVNKEIYRNSMFCSNQEYWLKSAWQF